MEGSVEFTVTGMSNGEGGNLILPDHEIFTMYEAGHGIAEPVRYNPEYRNNFYKVLLRVYGPIPDRVGAQKLIWINCAGGAPGYSPNGEPCPCGNSYYDERFAGDGNWDGSPQRIRVEWTRDAGARLYRNGTEVIFLDYTGFTPFGPSELHLMLGSPRADATDEAGMPIGAVFSDLHVEGTIGEPVTCQ